MDAAINVLPNAGCSVAAREHVIRLLKAAFAKVRRAYEEPILLAHLPHRRRTIDRVERTTATPGEALLAVDV